MSKRIESSSNIRSKLYGIVPYIDPICFSRRKNSNNETQVHVCSPNEKSDIYSLGVLLWEISSGQPPFCDKPYDTDLAMNILQGCREKPVPNTPEDYIKIYTGKHNLSWETILLFLTN